MGTQNKADQIGTKDGTAHGRGGLTVKRWERWAIVGPVSAEQEPERAGVASVRRTDCYHNTNT